MNSITEIQIVPVKPKDGLVAFCSFVFNDSLYCGSVGVVTRPEGGYRLLYPTRKTGDKSINVFHPINREIGQFIEKEVTKSLKEVMNNDRYSRFDI